MSALFNNSGDHHVMTLALSPLRRLATIALLLSGLYIAVSCSSYQQLSPYIMLSPDPPPMAISEERPKPPQPDVNNYIWRSGHWHYDGEHFVWRKGEFIQRPQPWSVWSPDRWERREYGWAFVPGYWQ